MPQKQVHCPYCKKLTDWEGNAFRPFCSKRCRMIDLGHWAAGDYAVPTKDGEGDDKSSQEIDSEDDSESKS